MKQAYDTSDRLLCSVASRQHRLEQLHNEHVCAYHGTWYLLPGSC